MGRGLSTIQKRILSFAWKEKFVTCQDLLSLWGVWPGDVVDMGKYSAAHSALSRSLSRLWWRGLIEYWQNKFNRCQTAISLTSTGISEAETIILEEEQGG
ncbi:MAG: hypothetical protein ACHQ2F_02555 [Desulfobaccales bacterium]